MLYFAFANAIFIMRIINLLVIKRSLPAVSVSHDPSEIILTG